MPYSRRMTRLRPVHSLKHIVDSSGTTSGGTTSTVDLIKTVDSPILANVNECQSGSTVPSIFLNVQTAGAVAYAGVPRIYFAVFKRPANNLTQPDPSGMGAEDVKRFVIHQEMMMQAQQGTTDETFPRTMFKGVLRIPPRMRRNGYDDRLQLLIQNATGESTGTTRWCVQCIYKEFR